MSLLLLGCRSMRSLLLMGNLWRRLRMKYNELIEGVRGMVGWGLSKLSFLLMVRKRLGPFLKVRETIFFPFFPTYFLNWFGLWLSGAKNSAIYGPKSSKWSYFCTTLYPTHTCVGLEIHPVACMWVLTVKTLNRFQIILYNFFLSALVKTCNFLNCTDTILPSDAKYICLTTGTDGGTYPLLLEM